MSLSRRSFLGGMTVALAGTRLPAATHELILAPQSIKAHLAGYDVSMLGFNGGLPGPEVRMRQGQTARITLDNRLEEGALVHWHGLRVPNRMDGVNCAATPLVKQRDIAGGDFGGSGSRA